MAEERAERRPTGAAGQAADIDTSVAHPARVYDYWLGGSNNFPADREAAERVLAATPGLRSRVRANRAFLARAVRYLAAEAGSPQGVTQYIDGDLRDASVILRAAAGTLDFTRPVALMLVGILHLIQDSEQPHRIVAGLMDALPSGSYLAISHPASDINARQAEAQRRYNERVSTPQTLRTRDEVTRFFEGLDLCRRASSTCTPGGPTPGTIPRRAGCRRTAARHASPDVPSSGIS